MFNAIAFCADHFMRDLYKDATGFRPSQATMDQWAAMSEKALRAEYEYLCDAVTASIDEDKKLAAEATVRFEAHIAKLMADHSIDRATAIRWDGDAMDAKNGGHYDADYHSFLHGLSMGYLGPEE